MVERFSEPLPRPEATLPTPEMVAQGVEEFDRLLSILSPNSQFFLAANLHFWRVFVGTTPELGNLMPALFPREEPYLQLEIQAMLATSKDFVLIPRDPDARRFSLVNLPAAVRVMGEYPQYFPPEATQEPRRWLSNTESWAPRIQSGLLSGYPPASVIRFSRDEQKDRTIVDPNSIGKFAFYDSGEEYDFVIKSMQIFKQSGIKRVVKRRIPEVMRVYPDLNSL